MLAILTELQKDVQEVKKNQQTTNQQIQAMYAEMTKTFEEFDKKVKEMDVKMAQLRQEVMDKISEVEAKTAVEPDANRGMKFQRTGLSSRRAASAEGRPPHTQVVLLGFPTELMQPTLQRVAESVKQTVSHSGAPPKIKAFDFSRKAIFVFQSEAQAQSFVERAEAHEFPFKCPLSQKQVTLRLKIHIPAEERTHAKTIGALRNQILKIQQDLDLGSNGARGDVFVRSGDQGTKLFKVHENTRDGKHEIDAMLAELQ